MFDNIQSRFNDDETDQNEYQAKNYHVLENSESPHQNLDSSDASRQLDAQERRGPFSGGVHGGRHPGGGRPPGGGGGRPPRPPEYGRPPKYGRPPEPPRPLPPYGGVYPPLPDNQRPVLAPPDIIPLKAGPSVLRIDPGAIEGCMFNFTYVWLKNGLEFWFYPTFLGRTSIAGFRWNRGRWRYIGFDLNSIDFFSCSGGF